MWFHAKCGVDPGTYNALPIPTPPNDQFADAERRQQVIA